MLHPGRRAHTLPAAVLVAAWLPLSLAGPARGQVYDFSEVTALCEGAVDGENVDLTDAQQMAQVFVGLLTPEANWLDGDLNNDENADLTDAQILAAFVVTGTCGV